MPEQHSDTILTQIADLESRLAFQDDTIETLNQLVIQQSDQIQRMEHKLKLLGQRLQQLQERSDDQEPNDPADEVPPHY
jgi:SlyX protein